MSWKAGSLYPCNPATARSESTKLGVDPKGEKLIYTNGRAVIIRDLHNPALAHAYTQHTQTTTVARFSPSGFYAASADVAGNVRIWDATNPTDAVLKLATRPLGGRINDLAWDGESKRIIVGGEGKDKFGAAFFIDSGSSCGEISGHAKPITALSVRHQRPFRAVSGSDDNSIVFHTAVPFKYDKMISTHTRFVRDVAFSPNGELFASVASDGKIFFYDGKTGEVKGESDRGSSSLMACSWSSDSARIATAGADGVVAIWDASTQKVAQTYTVGSDLSAQQNGIVYAGSNLIVSVSLSGELNVFDTRESPSSKWRVLHGPTKAITASSFSPSDSTFFTGSFDGSIKAFSISGAEGNEEGKCSDVKGTGHGARIVGISSDGSGKVWTTGWDDKVTSINFKSFSPSSSPTKSQPNAISATPNGVYVASPLGLEVQAVSGGGAATVKEGNFTAVAAFSNSTKSDDLIAVGEGKTVHMGKIVGKKFVEDGAFEDNKGDILALTFSPDGSLLAAGDATGRIILISVTEKKVLVSSRWTFHTGRITTLSFSPSNKRLASGATDENIYIWEVESVGKNNAIKNAHPGGVAGVSWVTDEKLISSGTDGCVRTWSQ